MLKVTDACKQAVDAYFDNLRKIDNMNLPENTKTQMKAQVTKNVVRESGWRDKMSEFVINSYISALGTPAVNLLSALVKAPLIITERALLGIMPGNKVKFNETSSMIRGFFEGMAEGINFGKQGYLEGMPLDTARTDAVAMLGKGANASKLEKAIAPVVTAPTRASVAVDEFSKAVFRRMQLNSMAYRVSRTVPEGNLQGLTRDELYTKLRTVDIGDPTSIGQNRVWKESLKGMSPDLVDDLVNFAKVQTFQAELGEIGNMLLRAKSKVPEIVFVAPFIKTPINILKDALSYTPANLFMKQFKGKKDEAAARLMIGAGIGAMTYYQLLQGNLTGAYPKEPGRRSAMQAAGIPEYSLKIGDKWYSYARIEPLATVMGVFSDATESLIDYALTPKADQKVEKLVADGVLAITKNLTSKTFLEGITSMLQALHDPERYGPAYINGFASMLVPGAVAQFARGVDPVQREVNGFADALQNRIPGLREKLPVRYDILGQQVANPANSIGGSLGIASATAEQTPLQKELVDVRFQYTKPEKKIRGVELDEQTYEKYSRLSGEFMNRQMSEVIQDPTYQSYSKAQRKFILERVAQRSRQAATNIILGEKLEADPTFLQEFQRQQLKRVGQSAN